MARRSLRRQDEEFTIPFHLCGNLPRPFELRKRGLLNDIVDSAGRPIIGCSQRDRCRDIFHIATRRTLPGSPRK